MRSALRRFLTRPSVFQVLRIPFQKLKFPFRSDLNNYAFHLRSQSTGLRQSSSLALVVKEEDEDGCKRGSTSWVGFLYGTTPGGGGKNGSWRHRLATFEQFQYESDLDGPDDKGSRLLDQSIYAENFDIWLELILFQRRQKGIETIKSLFQHIQDRKLELPTQGYTADELWEQFLLFGWERGRVWEDVIPYARKLRTATGRSWPKLYYNILRHQLRHQPNAAVESHESLYRDFPPLSEHLQKMFGEFVLEAPALAAFERIYQDLPIRNMYATIITRLCHLEDYGRAFKWHQLLMRVGDTPPSSVITKPLLQHLAVYGIREQMKRINNDVVDAGVTFRRPTEQSSRRSTPTHREQVLPFKRFDDRFCARIFATTAFSFDIIINGLQVLGIDAIGPLSLREIGLRERSSKAVRRRINQLRNCGIALGFSTYSTLIDSLASRGDDELLKDVIDYDMHPEAFEDLGLQESLLTSYEKSGDFRKAKLTLAILTAKVPSAYIVDERWNVLFRSALRREDHVNAYQILDAMQENCVQVSIRSSYQVRVQLLSQRTVSKRPEDTSELSIIISIFQRILKSGGIVSCYEWREIFRRLGMTGNLIELEKLSIWLADWYSSPIFRASQSSVFTSDPKAIRKYFRPGRPNDPVHLLRIIFSRVTQQAMIAWGFKHQGDIWNGAVKIRDPCITWRWGIELLRKLRARQVPVKQSTVSRACKLRLIPLFGEGQSARITNRSARVRNPYSLEYYAQEIEKVWGGDLFRLGNSLPQGDPRRFLPLKMEVRKKLSQFRTRGRMSWNNRLNLDFLEDGEVDKLGNVVVSGPFEEVDIPGNLVESGPSEDDLEQATEEDLEKEFLEETEVQLASQDFQDE